MNIDDEYVTYKTVLKNQFLLFVFLSFVSLLIHECSHVVAYTLCGVSGIHIEWNQELFSLATVTPFAVLTIDQMYFCSFAGGLFTSIIFLPLLYRKHIAGAIPLIQFIYGICELNIRYYTLNGLSINDSLSIVIMPYTIILSIVVTIYMALWSFIFN